MGTIAEKLQYLLQTKEQIRQAIAHKGVAVPEETPFRRYPELIEGISNGDGMKIRLRTFHSKHNAAAAAVVESYMAIRAAVE